MTLVEEQAHWLTEQKGLPRNSLAQVWPTDFWQSCKNNSMVGSWKTVLE